VLIITGVLLASVLARGAVESEKVTAGVAAFDAADFQHAIELLKGALDESLTREERVVAYRTLAFCYAALDQPASARGAFVELLRLDDKFELDRRVAPRVRALLEEARAAVATGHAAPSAGNKLPELKPEVSPSQLREGRPAQISVTWRGGSANRMTLFHRSRGQPRYMTVNAAPGAGGKFTLDVPGDSVNAPALEYYLTALDADGASVARAGTFSEPLVIDVQGTAKPVGMRSRAWIWGVAGGAVAVAVLGLGLGLGLGLPDGNAPAQVSLIAPR
jgi:hypothetical protein